MLVVALANAQKIWQHMRKERFQFNNSVEPNFNMAKEQKIMSKHKIDAAPFCALSI